MKFRSSFIKSERHINQNSGEIHPLFQDERPLSIKEMLRRAQSGIPLSISKPVENIPLNGKFFNDKFDIIDTAIRNDMRLSNEQKLKDLEAQKQARKDMEEFKQWKQQQLDALRNVKKIDEVKEQ